MKTLITFLTALLATSNSWCQVCDEKTYQAYVGLRDIHDSKALWEKTVAAKQEAFEGNKSSTALRWNLALAQFGLLSSTLRDHDEDLFDKYFKVNEKHWQELIKENKKWPEARALLSALYGLKMGYSPMQGMVLGPKSGMLMNKAKDEAPGSAIVWKVYGNSKLFTPSMFGGDIPEAIRSFERAIELFEQKPEELVYNWWYVDSMVFLGQAYTKDGQISKAIETYEKVLKFEPNQGWVKYSLLPKAKEKASQK